MNDCPRQNPAYRLTLSSFTLSCVICGSVGPTGIHCKSFANSIICAVTWSLHARKVKNNLQSFLKVSFSLILLVGTGVISGCSSQPQKVQIPPIPEDKIDRVEVEVEFSPISNLSRSAVQVPYSKIPLKSSIFIDRGSLELAAGKNVIDAEQAYNIAYEEMQKELIRKGFRVLEQGQVRSKLLELAIKNGCKDRQLWWRCAAQLSSDEVLFLNDLKSKLDSGELEPSAFSKEVAKQKASWEKRVASSKALVAAAQEGNVDIDYVLEIKDFKPATKVQQSLRLKDYPQLREFISEYPDLQVEFDKRDFMQCAGVGSELKARLIETKSAEVIWMGRHTVSEMTAEGNEYLLEMGTRKYAANAEEVEQFIRDQSSKKKNSKANARIPVWRYETILMGPNLVQGSCVLTNRSVEDLRLTSNELSGRVARELLGTISVEGRTSSFSGPSLEFKSNEIRRNPTSYDFLNDSVGPLNPN
jgi:Uncharacterized lipoprotein